MPNYFQISPVVFDNNYILMFTTDQIYFSTIGEVGSPLKVYLCQTIFKGALSWYGKLTWESAHAWNLIILCLLIVWGMTFIFMVHLSFLCNSIANL